LIVPAYNEESCLPEKIANLKQLDYPPEKMEVIFVSDGSSDRTAEILKGLNDPNVHTIFVPQRKGKFNALNQAASAARTEILVFSDANTLFAPDVVQKLVRHFSQPTVGVVCGNSSTCWRQRISADGKVCTGNTKHAAHDGKVD